MSFPLFQTKSLPEAKVLYVEQRQLPSTKRAMSAVWATKDVLFLQQDDLKPQLAMMMAQLNEWVQQVPEQPRQYAKGDFVCAQFSEDNMWYRGQVSACHLRWQEHALRANVACRDDVDDSSCRDYACSGC